MAKFETLSADGSVSPDAEELVVGGALGNPVFAAVVAALEPDYFTDGEMRSIAKAIGEIHALNGEIDGVKVAAHVDLPFDRVRDLEAAASMWGERAFDSAVSVLRDRRLRRSVSDIARAIADEAAKQGSNIASATDKGVASLLEVMADDDKSGLRSIRDVIGDYGGRLNDLMRPDSSKVRVPTGWRILDSVLGGGIIVGGITVIGGRPAMGKTMAAVNIIENACRAGSPSVFFSLEMPSVQILHRLLCCVASVDNERFQSGRIDADEQRRLRAALHEIADWPLWISDSPALTPQRAMALVKRIKAREDVKLVVVDYLQLMDGGGNSRHDNMTAEVSRASRGMLAVAKHCDVAVIAVAQLSRIGANRSRSERAPMLTDLRQSGQIEQDAHTVVFVHRPEVYDETDASLYGVAEFIVAKNRSGREGKVELKFEGEFYRFRTFDDRENTQ